jgi:hypothetical protein
MLVSVLISRISISRLHRVLYGYIEATPEGQAVVGSWQNLWPGQEWPRYDDGPLKVLDRLTPDARKLLLTHSSVNSASNYEELEWVGDAAVELMARRMIYKHAAHLTLTQKSVSPGFASRSLPVGI